MIDSTHNYNNHLIQTKEYNTTTIYRNGFIGPFYSIKLREYLKVFNVDLKSLHHARASSVILFHLSKYSRCLQTNMANLYGLSCPLINKILKLLLEGGLIISHPTRRKTNINAYVLLTAYSITPLGKEHVKHLNDLLAYKVSILNK
jgi:hypothetical protein